MVLVTFCYMKCLVPAVLLDLHTVVPPLPPPSCIHALHKQKMPGGIITFKMKLFNPEDFILNAPSWLTSPCGEPTAMLGRWSENILREDHLLIKKDRSWPETMWLKPGHRSSLWGGRGPNGIGAAVSLITATPCLPTQFPTSDPHKLYEAVLAGWTSSEFCR